MDGIINAILKPLEDFLGSLFRTFFLDTLPKPLLYMVLALIGEIILSIFASVILDLIGKVISANTPIIFYNNNNTTSPVQYVITHMLWYTIFIMLVGIMISGMRMMFGKNNYMHFKQFIKGIFVYTISSMTLLQVIVLCVTAGDEFSKWVINEAGDASSLLDNSANFDNLVDFNLTSVFTAIIALLGIVIAVFEWLIMYARAGILGLLIALLPFAGATAVTTHGMNYFKRMLVWIISFLIYKPACALIFAYCLELLKAFSDLNHEMVGVATLFLCIIALPSIVQLISPMQSFNMSGASLASSLVGMGAGLAVGSAMMGGGGAAATGARQTGENHASGIGDGGGTSVTSPAGSPLNGPNHNNSATDGGGVGARGNGDSGGGTSSSTGGGGIGLESNAANTSQPNNPTSTGGVGGVGSLGAAASGAPNNGAINPTSNASSSNPNSLPSTSRGGIDFDGSRPNNNGTGAASESFNATLEAYDR